MSNRGIVVLIVVLLAAMGAVGLGVAMLVPSTDVVVRGDADQ